MKLKPRWRTALFGVLIIFLFIFFKDSSSDLLEVSSQKPVRVRLQFEKGWKLNAGAPTQFALFDLNTDRMLATYTQKDWEMGEPVLHGMVEGHLYHLKGDVYYCQEIDSNVCKIKKINLKVLPVRSAQRDDVMIDLSTP